MPVYDSGVVVTMERARIPARYRIVEEVGQGGMAVVYRARDESLKRDVAIKVLHDHLAAEPESKARLEREAQAVAKLKHDNILEIFDYSGGTADAAFIVTEFIDGETLSRFLSSHQIRHPEIAVLIAVELGEALRHAHELGIIHRDIKPENVMIRKDGLLKLTDFGIAQVVDLQRMTVTGQLLGSPAYMSPELVEGRPLDFRTDVFSLGILLYQCATGALPFSGKNPHEVLRRVAEGKFSDPRIANPLIGAKLCRFLARALAREPAQRFPDVATMVDELREHLAEAGLVDARAELRVYFSDPAAYEAALPDRMAPALRSAADRYLRAGKAMAPRAIECWNRVLAFRPDDPEVATALRRFERRNRAKTALTLGAAAAAMAVALLGIGRLATSSKPEAGLSDGPSPINASVAASAPVASPPSTAPAARSGAVPAPAPAGPAAGTPAGGSHHAAENPIPKGGRTGRARSHEVDHPGERVATAERPRHGDERGRGEPTVAALPVPTRTFTLGPTPQNVDVYVDGEKQFSYDTDHKTLTVPWSGTHVVEFRSPSGCCFVERVEIGPDQPVPAENVIARKLKWKPARLMVTLDPPTPAAQIMMRDPERPGTGTVIEVGEEANVPFLASEDDGLKEIEIDVAHPRGLTTERLMVRAGQRSRLAVKVRATP